jgi:hypothetical protein
MGTRFTQVRGENVEDLMQKLNALPLDSKVHSIFSNCGQMVAIVENNVVERKKKNAEQPHLKKIRPDTF